MRAGISEDDIPSNDWIAAIIAADEKWLTTTEDGMKHFSRLFCFNTKPGDEHNDYMVVDNIQRTVTEVKNTEVMFFEGALVRGVPVPIANPYTSGPTPVYELEISERTKNVCDGCGITAHCLMDIRDPITSMLSSMCNYCLTYHEHPRVHENGGLVNCQRCTVLSCKHHPKEIPDECIPA